MKKTLKVGLIGAGFMAKAHSIAYATMSMHFWPTPAQVIRKTICDLTEEGAKIGAQRYGFESYTTNWMDIIDDPDIDIVDIATPNDSHAEIAIAAAKAGKHIFCEKPIARTLEEAKNMRDAVQTAGVKNMLAFNYRRTPAITLAKKLINEGSIGEIINFRGTYLQDWSADPNSPLSWRFQKSIAGSGTLGDIGTHVIDIARYLVGEMVEVCGKTNTYISERPLQSGGVDQLGVVKAEGNVEKGIVDVDDEVAFMIQFDNGAFGSIEATRNAWGRNNFITFEIHGKTGSIYFDYERMNELRVYFQSDPDDRRGFRTIYTGPSHPNGEALWPIPALGIGYAETKVIECHDFIKSIVYNEKVSPDFEDGYKIELICDAVVRSSEENKWIKIGS